MVPLPDERFPLILKKSEFFPLVWKLCTLLPSGVGVGVGVGVTSPPPSSTLPPLEELLPTLVETRELLYAAMADFNHELIE